jgi:Spy/CpxP family protein refolding chaperone
MKLEFRTLLKSISTLVMLLTLVFGASLGVMAQGNSRRGRSHNRGRHLGWTKGRHRGWSQSNHRGVRNNDNLGDNVRRNNRSDRDALTRRNDNRDNNPDHNRDSDMRGHGRRRGRH